MSEKKEVINYAVGNCHDLWSALYSMDNLITFDDPDDDIKQAVRKIDAELKGMLALVENWKQTVQS